MTYTEQAYSNTAFTYTHALNCKPRSGGYSFYRKKAKGKAILVTGRGGP
jgi:hypothetical protein